MDDRFIGIVGGIVGGAGVGSDFSATSGDDTFFSEKREPAESLRSGSTGFRFAAPTCRWTKS